MAHFKIHDCLNKEIRGILTRTIVKKFLNDALKDLSVGQKLQKFEIPDKTFVAIVLHLLQLLIGNGHSGGKRKNKEELRIKYQPVEIRQCFLYQVEVSSFVRRLLFIIVWLDQDIYYSSGFFRKLRILSLKLRN